MSSVIEPPVTRDKQALALTIREMARKAACRSRRSPAGYLSEAPTPFSNRTRFILMVGRYGRQLRRQPESQPIDTTFWQDRFSCRCIAFDRPVFQKLTIDDFIEPVMEILRMVSGIIDIHPHVISPDESKYPRNPLGGILSDWARDRPITPDMMIAAMDEAGVSRSALVQASTCYGYDNSLVADAVRAYPARFDGVFSVDVLAADAPAQIHKWVGRGLSCLRLFTTGSTMPDQAGWLDDPRSFPAWEYAQEIGLPVCVQMRLKAVHQLRNLLEKFPKATVILDHLASPDASDGPPYLAAQPLFDLARYPNVFLKLTIRNIRMIAEGGGPFEPYFRKIVDLFGPSRIAWGSNFPTSDSSLKKIVDESLTAIAFLSVEEREWVFRRTAEKLYPSLAR